MENNSKVLGKIRALMSKTVENGASESEMEQAIAMAQALMAKHSIEESEILISIEDIEKHSVTASPVGEEGANWQWDLLCAIGNGYNCHITRKQAHEKINYRKLYYWNITGFPQDIAMVKETYEILLTFIRNLYKIRYKEYKSRTENPIRYGVFVRNYIVGFVSGLDEKLKAAKKEIFAIPEQAATYELIVIKKDDLIKDWVDRNVKLGKPAKTNFTKDVSIEAQSAGYNDGKQAEDKKQLH